MTNQHICAYLCVLFVEIKDIHISSPTLKIEQLTEAFICSHQKKANLLIHSITISLGLIAFFSFLHQLSLYLFGSNVISSIFIVFYVLFLYYTTSIHVATASCFYVLPLYFCTLSIFFSKPNPGLFTPYNMLPSSRIKSLYL